MTRIIIAALAALVIGAPIASIAAPTPAPVPKRWQLDLEMGDLQTIVVNNRPYFFLTYRVTNYTGQDQTLAPAFELGADNGDLMRPGTGVPADVTREILQILQDPLLEDQLSMLGKIQQGEENARDGLVVWPIVDLKVDEVVVYAAGFSGETDVLSWTDPESGDQVRIVLRKTLEQRYCTPGHIDPTDPRPFELCERPRWIMR